MTRSDVSICISEVSKLISVLRSSERYSDVTRPSILWPREQILPSPTPVATRTVPSSSPRGSVDAGSAAAMDGTSSAGVGSVESTPLSSVSIPSSVETATTTSSNSVAQLVGLAQALSGKDATVASVGIVQVLAPMMQIILDPSMSGFVTAAALSSTFRLLPLCIGDVVAVTGVMDCVTRTKFTETDRDSDETVLMRICNIVEYILTKAVVDKSRVATGLQCVQTIWISDNHSAALRDCARQAVYRVLLHVVGLEGGCDGYAATLMDNVCLNMELLSKQPLLTFDSDKLAFFTDVLSALPSDRWPGMDEMVPFQLSHSLYWLLPAGPAAASVDPNSTSVLLRHLHAFPVSSSLFALAHSVLRQNLDTPSLPSALAVESLITSMFCRPLAATDSEPKLAGLGDTCLSVMSAKKPVSASMAPNGYINVVPSGTSSGVNGYSTQVTVHVLESLVQLLRGEPLLLPQLWESFDCVWHRSEVACTLIDSVVQAAVSGRVLALTSATEGHDRDRVQRALHAFFTLAVAPESTIDVDSLVPSYVECLSVDALKHIVDSWLACWTAGDSAEAEDQTPQQFLIRLSAREVSKQMKAKPKKTAELVEQFLSEFKREIKPPVPAGAAAVAWALRLLPSMDFDALGEFFGQPTEMSCKALSHFIRSLNLQDMDPEEALRACLQSFRLPGEAQQIDRIVKEIAYEYYESHSDLTVEGNYFASADAAYTFLFSVIMLNTDQHNPQVKRRMELKDFIRNNRKINDGADIPEQVQARVFASIRNSQIVTPKSASFFCCPLKGRWKDLWFMHKSEYIPGALRAPGKHTVCRMLAAKGYDVLIAASYLVARDPKRYTRAVEVVASLAELCLKITADSSTIVDPVVRSLGVDCVSVLRKYAVKSFATVASSIAPTPRSFDCLSAILRLEVSGTAADTLLEATGAMLCYWAPYEWIIARSQEATGGEFPLSWEEVLSVPILDLGSNAQSSGGGGAISQLFRGLLNPLYDNSTQPGNTASAASQVVDVDDMSPIVIVSATGTRRSASMDSLMQRTDDWRKELIRASLSESSPNAPSASQLSALRGVEVDKYVASLHQGGGAIVLMMLELVSVAASSPMVGGGANAGYSEEFWTRELVRSSPWALLLAAKLLAASSDSDLLASTTAREALLAVIRQYISGHLSDPHGLKLVVFTSFAFLVLFAQRDPLSDIVDPAWILPILDELSSFAADNAALSALGPVICSCITMLFQEAPAEFLAKVGAPVWRELVKLVAAVSPKAGKASSPAAETGKKICLETLLHVLVRPDVLGSFAGAANGANDLADCIVALEQALQARMPQRQVSKSLSEFACRLAGIGPSPGSGFAWACVVGRIAARVTSVAKQKKPTGPELSDSVELLRMCLGDPRVHQILSPAQAGATIEKCASALSAVVSANTPPGALQAALCVFARFFLTCLEKLQQHPQFDHLWLMSLRVILLFIKRGHDDASMEQLAEVTTETLRNALQVLIASNLLALPHSEPAAPAEPVWWKVTWEIVETFCPGMWDELAPSASTPIMLPVSADPIAAAVESLDHLIRETTTAEAINAAADEGEDVGAGSPQEGSVDGAESPQQVEESDGVVGLNGQEDEAEEAGSESGAIAGSDRGLESPLPPAASSDVIEKNEI